MSMRPITPHAPLAPHEVPPPRNGGPARASLSPSAVRPAPSPTVRLGTRDVAEAATGTGGTALERLLGRVPPRGARGLAALLSPPPRVARRGAAEVAAVLRRTARRARAASGAADPLRRAGDGDPRATALLAAVEREERLGQVLERLGALRDDVTAAMTAVSPG